MFGAPGILNSHQIDSESNLTDRLRKQPQNNLGTTQTDIKFRHIHLYFRSPRHLINQLHEFESKQTNRLGGNRNIQRDQLRYK